MNRYECLVVLDIAGNEEGVGETIDRISKRMSDAGAKIETVQKMDKRPFSRVVDKRIASGFYVNFIVEAESGVVEGLQEELRELNDVHRLLMTLAPEAVAESEAPTSTPTPAAATATATATA